MYVCVRGVEGVLGGGLVCISSAKNALFLERLAVTRLIQQITKVTCFEPILLKVCVLLYCPQRGVGQCMA